MHVFLPSVLRPLPGDTGVAGPRVQHIAEVPFSVVRGPSGSYVAEWLAGLIAGWGRWQDCVWLRTPATRPLAGRLLQACRYRWAGDDQEQPLTAGPAGQLDQALRLTPRGGVVVLELDGRAAPGLARLGEAVRPVAWDRGLRVIAVVQPRLPAMTLAGSAHVAPTAELGRLPASDAAAALPARSYHRLMELAGRRIAVAHDVLDAARVRSAEAVADALGRSQTLRAALDRLTASLLELCTPGQRAALEVCAATGYWHPQLVTHGAAASMLRPWVVPLEGDWGWLRPIWARALRRQLADDGSARPHPPRAVAAAPAPVPSPLAATPSASEPDAPPPGLVEARLLGPFQLLVDGRPVPRWAGQRGASVLRFLLARPHHRCSRDELLAEFWPEVDPATARNRLQVAVSGLRRALQEVTRLQVIEYADGGYRINPELLVEVDVERFERALATARRAERSGDPEAALAAYREAVELYRGEFAADAPFEQWALLPRERLRLSYLDTLDQMSRIQLRSGRLDDTISTGLRMVAADPCREDAHRLLMRCYARQGRTYQALRQYEFCCRMLRATLDVGPAPETEQVYLSIRAGSAAGRG
jgi:DNA-binding SARP family transcriptional activator